MIVFLVTSIALTLVPLGTKLLTNPAQFLIGSPGTLCAHRFDSHRHSKNLVTHQEHTMRPKLETGAAIGRHNLYQQKKQPNWVREKDRGGSISSGRLSGREVRARSY